MFRSVPLSIIRCFSLYTQQWYMSYRFADNLQEGSGWNILILLASCMTYTTAVCTVKNSWWTEELSETCRVLFQKQIWEISASSWFYYTNLTWYAVTWTSESSGTIAVWHPRTAKTSNSVSSPASKNVMSSNHAESLPYTLLK